jgi:hypothetical protein
MGEPEGEPLPHCSEQQRCAGMTPQEKERRCACKRLSTPAVAWKLTRDDRVFLKSLRIKIED